MSFDVSRIRHLYPWTPKRLALPGRGGRELSYLDEGPRDAETLLMVHGNPSWSFYYRGLIKAFSHRYRCVAIDHIGCGLSDKPQDYPYTLSSHITNLGRLAEALGLRERVTMVVHDWGGPIGLGWALRHLDAVERTVILNTAAFRSERIHNTLNAGRIPVFGDLAIRGCNAFALAASKLCTVKPLPRDVAYGYVGPYDSWANRIATLRFVQDIPAHPGIPSWAPLVAIEAELPKLAEKPMLICWGGKDFVFDDHFLGDWVRRFPEAEVHRYADAGHYVLEDAGAQIAERVGAFLTRTAELAEA